MANLARDLEYVFAQLKLYGAKSEADRQREKRRLERSPARETRQRRRHRANVARMAYGRGDFL